MFARHFECDQLRRSVVAGDSFRLVVDGVSTAPYNMLNELVDSHAAKEGTVQFAFPETAKILALQIDKFGADVKGLPIVLPDKR